MKRTVPSILLGLLGLVWGLAPAHAGFDIFMQLTGIAGESVEPNHKGWIEVRSFNHALSNPGAGSSGGGGSSKVSHAEFAIAKHLDKASLPINLKVNQGAHIDSVVVEFQTTGANKLVFYRVTMTDAVVVSTSIRGAAGEDRITDEIALSYKKIVWEYWPIDASGKLGQVVRSEWDISTNTGK